MTVANTYHWLSLTGPQKTALLNELAAGGATEPLIRQTAVRIVRGLPRDDHRARLERLHRFVRDAVEYHREPVEMFHRPTQTLLEGGDCDDHVALLCALGWSLKYPWLIEPVGSPEGPSHYTCMLGYPPADEPHGDERTIWFPTETTVDAKFGEHVAHADRRLSNPENELDKKRFEECLTGLMQAMSEIQSGMTEREQLAFQAGLRASHAEEAFMQGDEQRAQAHFSKLLEFMGQLRR